MIDYETFCKIRDYRDREGLKQAQIARALGLDERTVAKWIDEPRYRPRQSPVRASKLDPFKPKIRQWLESHPYSAQQVFKRRGSKRRGSGLTFDTRNTGSVLSLSHIAEYHLSFGKRGFILALRQPGQ